ncbi:MAG: alpha/beta hydrolase [Actinomycetota bacterium]|nr:alpha/beta hydrolase [Actinomycetota bacterium]
MTHRPGRHRRPLLALGALALVTAACGTSAATGGPSTSTSAAPRSSATSSSSTTTTTTTTTTLPRPVRLSGTGGTGAGTSGGTPGPTASYGAVERVQVVPLANGASAPPTTTTSLPDPPGTVQIAYHELGSGPDLVLVPPQHASTTSWDPAAVQALAQHYTLVLFDPPGVGYSAPDPAARSVESEADVAGGLVAALGLRAPTVLGWGMGAEVALSLAERHPGVVGRLVLVDPTAGGPGAPRPSAAAQGLLGSPSATPAELAGLEVTGAAARSALVARLGAYAPDDLTTAAIRQEASVVAASWHDPAVAAGLGAIRAPALVVIGTAADPVVPVSESETVAARLHRARRLELANAGYGVLTVDTARVVSAVEAFTS